MANIPYVLGIPAASHNPSNDQPDMLENTNAINQLIGIDHVAFNATNGGFHQQVTFANNPTVIPTSSGAGSGLLYSGPGSASVAPNQQFFVSTGAQYLLSCVKAFGTFVIPNSVTNFPAGNAYNIVGNIDCTTIGPIRCVVTLATGTLASSSSNSNVVVLFSFSNQNALLGGYTVAPTQVTFNLGSSTGQFNFALLQF